MLLTGVLCCAVDRAEHKRWSPKCAFVKVKDPYGITVANVLDLEKEAIEHFVVSISLCH